MTGSGRGLGQAIAGQLAAAGARVALPADTAMQAWIRSQHPERIGVARHERCTSDYEQGSLLTAHQPASLPLRRLATGVLRRRLATGGTGQIWDAANPP